MDGTLLNKKLKIEEKLAQLNEIAQKVDDMPTFTSNDRTFLEELPGFPVTDGKKVLTATTESGETTLSYEEPEAGVVDYSTTEQATGHKWLNKDTYIIVIDMGEEKTVVSNAWYTVGNHLGAETIINGVGISGGGGTIPMQIVEDTTDGIKILQTRNTQVGVRYLWLEYTKTELSKKTRSKK